jgi:DNA (cytosine-5)-methyltransferase 1
MDGYWLSEPDIPRTAKGMKNRVPRLKALGNAVVPMQAYPIFRAIMKTEFFEEWRD